MKSKQNIGRYKFMLSKIIAAVFIIVGLYLIYSAISQSKKCSAEAVGTVTGRESKRERRGSRKHRRTTVAYYPVVEFEANGQVITGTADISSSNPDKYADGSTLSIRYNPEDPQEFIIKNKSAMGSLVPAILMILIGAAYLIFVK